MGIRTTVCDTLCSPLCADGIGQSVAVFGNVGGETVVADTGVGEAIGVTFVGGGRAGRGALVEADERALGCLLLAPEVCNNKTEGVS